MRRKRYHSSDKSYFQNNKNGPRIHSISSCEPSYLNRSPAKRKRDLFLKRRSFSTNSLPARTTSAPCELSSMAECDENEADVDLLGTEIKEHENGSNYSRNSSIDSCYMELSTFPDKRRTSCHSCCSNSGYEGVYSVFDIVGESFEARFPWQRDVSTQCNIVIDCCRDREESLSRRCSERNLMNSPTSQQLLKLRRTKLGQRPHSIGCVGVCDEEFLRVRFEQSQQPRTSDSCLQVSPRSNRRRSSPYYLEEFGTGSVSDLGSISEIPDFERSVFFLMLFLCVACCICERNITV